MSAHPATVPRPQKEWGQVLSIKQLQKRRLRGDSAFVLSVPQLDLPKGAFIAVVGASGCGKSTLLDVIALVLRPDAVEHFHLEPAAGSTIDVASLWRDAAEDRLANFRAQQMGYVLQAGGLLPFLTVRENIALPARIKGLRDLVARVDRTAVQLGIEDTLNSKPQHLSGGQRQRVAIARALVHEPVLVLADEPTAAVDETRAMGVVADFRRLARERGTTIVMVTHDRDLVMPVADELYTFEVAAVSRTQSHATCHRITPASAGAGVPAYGG